jgi:hypothetical protein
MKPHNILELHPKEMALLIAPADGLLDLGKTLVRFMSASRSSGIGLFFGDIVSPL